MNLITFTLSLLLAMAPSPVERDPARTAAAFVERAQRLASDFEVAVSFGPLPFEGPAAAEATTAALTAIAYHEGAGFMLAVENCSITADGGKTVSLFGLMKGAAWRGRERHELCRGGPLPAYLSLLALEGYARRCRTSPPIGWFRGYASGSCAVKSDAAARLCGIWERLAARGGLVGASCEKRQPITRREPLRVAER
jgi:hypothetical protein